MIYEETIKVTEEWVDLVAAGKINPRYSYTIENIGTSELRYIAAYSATIPEEYSKHNILHIDSSITIPTGIANLFVRVSKGDEPFVGHIAIGRSVGFSQLSTIRNSVRLTEPRQLVTNLTQIEFASVEGRVYYVNVEMELSAGSSGWFAFYPAADKQCAVFSRDIKHQYTGIEYQVYTGTSGFNDGSAYNIKNQNKTYQVASTTSVSSITTPTSMGVLSDIPVWVPPNGTNPAQRSAGTSAVDTGFTVYNAANPFYGRVINSSGNTNRVITRISWLEAASNIFEL